MSGTLATHVLTPDVGSCANDLTTDVVETILQYLGAADAPAAGATCAGWADVWRRVSIQRHGMITLNVLSLPRVVPWRITSPPPGSLPHEAEHHRRACVPTASVTTGVRHRVPDRAYLSRQTSALFPRRSSHFPPSSQPSRSPDCVPRCTLLGVAAICTLPDGRICACISDGVTVLSLEMGVIARITDAGEKARPGEGLRNVTAIAADDTSLFVVDTSLGAIFRYCLTDFRLLRSSDWLYSGDCEAGHQIAVGGGRVYYTAGVSGGWSSRPEHRDSSLVHVFDAVTLEVLHSFPTIQCPKVADEYESLTDRLTDCGPSAIAIHGDRLFIVDISEHSWPLIQIFRTDGTHIGSISPPAGYYDYPEEIPEDGRPHVWQHLCSPGKICIAHEQIYLLVDEQVVDCDPDQDDGDLEDRTATAVAVFSLSGAPRQMFLLQDDLRLDEDHLEKLGVEPLRCSEWSLAPGPDGTLLLAESRHAKQPPGADGYCEHEGFIHVLRCAPRRVPSHLPFVHDSIMLHPSARRQLAEGRRTAVTKLAVVFLKKTYQQRRERERLHELRRYASLLGIRIKIGSESYRSMARAASMEWDAAIDPMSGRTYYYNRVTRETSWDRPRRSRSLLQDLLPSTGRGEASTSEPARGGVPVPEPPPESMCAQGPRRLEMLNSNVAVRAIRAALYISWLCRSTGDLHQADDENEELEVARVQYKYSMRRFRAAFPGECVIPADSGPEVLIRELTDCREHGHPIAAQQQASADIEEYASGRADAFVV